jgi:hypothetical protein
MKKLAVILIFVACFTNAGACDICGCGVGGSYIGILPEFNQHVLGLRYRLNSLTTHLGTGGSTTYLTTEEKYQTFEFWGGWNIGEKFRVMAAVPYAFNEKSNQGISNRKNGIGDISVSGYYQLFNRQRTIPGDKILVQTLWAGAGMKLPTGKYADEDKPNALQNTNLFQLGTGSVDFTFNAMYDLRLQNAGLNISGSYKMNSANKYDYNYGNKVNTSAQVYYKFRVKEKLTIAPNAGMVYEHSKKDIDNKMMVDVSGGKLLQGSIGLETALRKLSIGASWQTPLTQDLADGFVRTNNRFMLHFSFIL